MRVVLDGLGHRFSDAPWLFRGLTITLEAGRSYALVGPSGSGKSTLMSLIAGWVEPVEGSVQLDGVAKISWVFQSPHGIARRSALDHVVLPMLAAGLGRGEAEPRATALLDSFDLAEVADREFRALSGGQAQRLMLARAVAAGPQLLLVDEPTAQLDHVTARKVDAAIGAMAASDRVVLVATHDPSTQQACTDRLDLVDYSAARAPAVSS